MLVINHFIAFFPSAQIGFQQILNENKELRRQLESVLATAGFVHVVLAPAAFVHAALAHTASAPPALDNTRYNDR